MTQADVRRSFNPKSKTCMASYTSDTFFNGSMKVLQSRRGYRFSIDAVLLAFHATPRQGEKVLDLGAGCGIISLIMAFRSSDLKIYAVEIQKELADLALFNVRENRLEDHIDILCTDLKVLMPQMIAGPCDLIVCNPPYFRSGSGRVNPDSQRALARHEIKASLRDVLQAARRLLRTGGRFVIIYTAERTTDLLCQMRMTQIEPKWIRMVHPVQDASANLILIEGIKGGRSGLKVAPPLIVYEKNGDYTDELQRMFEP